MDLLILFQVLTSGRFIQAKKKKKHTDVGIIHMSVEDVI